MSSKISIKSLTGIRFFAAIFVIFFHYLDTKQYAGLYITELTRYGYVGVSLFFVLSGFVLAYNYPNFTSAAERNRFWWARFARIYPLYLVALLASLPAYFVFADLSSLAEVIKTAGKIGLEVTLLGAWTP